MIVIGNTLVLIAIVVSGKRRSRMNFFIINLACAGTHPPDGRRNTWHGRPLHLCAENFESNELYGLVQCHPEMQVQVLKRYSIPSSTNISTEENKCTDLSVGLLLVLTDIIWKVTIEWYAGNVGCKLVKFLQCYATYGATYALVALSIDRFHAITRPLSVAGIEKRCRLLVGLSWGFAALFSLPMFFIYELKLVDGIQQCWLEMTEPMWKLYLSLVSFAVFIIPAIIIATCYIVIVVVIWSKSSLKFKSSPQNYDETTTCLPHNGAVTVRFGKRKTETLMSGATSSRGVIPKAKIKTIKMTFVIVLAFIMCWSPYFVWDLLSVYGHIPVSQQTIAISTFIQSLAPLNSAANPLVYILFNAALCTRIFKKGTNYNSPPYTQGYTLTSFV